MTFQHENYGHYNSRGIELFCKCIIEKLFGGGRGVQGHALSPLQMKMMDHVWTEEEVKYF